MQSLRILMLSDGGSCGDHRRTAVVGISTKKLDRECFRVGKSALRQSLLGFLQQRFI
jgi:hypothetical protein